MTCQVFYHLNRVLYRFGVFTIRHQTIHMPFRNLLMYVNSKMVSFRSGDHLDNMWLRIILTRFWHRVVFFAMLPCQSILLGSLDL